MSIKLELEANEIEAVVAGLRKSFTMEFVEELVIKIKIQAIPQIQAAQAAQIASETPSTPAANTNA